MPEVISGEKFVFNAFFVDEVNTPVVVDNPTISIFNFSSSGIKQVYVDAAPMLDGDPPEVGRYTYVYTVPTTLVDGDTLYAEMTGTSAGLTLLIESEVSVITTGRFSVPGLGVTTRFIK